MPLNISGKWFNASSPTASTTKEEIDYDAMETKAREHQPADRRRCIGYALRIDFERFAKIAEGSWRHLHGRHGPLRRPDRRRRLSEPGAASPTS